jgi:DNA invertase Pin-like site-specific DNA recombinase
MKAVGYVRVSTEGQAINGASCDMQHQRIEDYCRLRGFDLVAIQQDNGVSGSKPLGKREAGASLLEDLKRGEVQHVIALKLDRLFRDAIDALEVVRAWDREGITLHLVDMGGDSLSTASATGKCFLTMAAAFAELERGLGCERTRQVKRHRKATGKTYSTAPMGYDNNGGILVENPVELETVNRIRELKAAGVSMNRIAATFNTEGRKTKRGGKWYASTIAYLLKNNLYAAA